MAAQERPPVSYQPMAYPASARNAGVSGAVILAYSLGADGKPASIEILSGHRLLAPAAKANLDTWVFAGGARSELRRVTYVFEIVEEMGEGSTDRKKEEFVFERESLVRVRTRSRTTLSDSDCPAVQMPKLPEVVLAGDSVSLGRGGCYGTCPSYEVKLFGDGRVEWKGDAFVDVRGYRAYTIDPSQAQRILRRFRSPKVLRLCGEYSRSVTDSSSTRTTIIASGVKKVVFDYANSSPFWFRELLEEFDEVAQTHALRHGDPATEPLIRIQEEYLPKPGMTELMRAAAQGDLVRVKHEIAAGANLEAVDASGWTALMYAAASGGVVDELLRAGANRNHRSPFGDTPLMAAALRGEFDADLAKGGKELVNARNKDGVTALMLLAARGAPDEISAALRAGADATRKDRLGRTAVDYLDAISCSKNLVRGYKTFLEISGPCQKPGKEIQKARRLLIGGSGR